MNKKKIESEKINTKVYVVLGVLFFVTCVLSFFIGYTTNDVKSSVELNNVISFMNENSVDFPTCINYKDVEVNSALNNQQLNIINGVVKQIALNGFVELNVGINQTLVLGPYSK